MVDKVGWGRAVALEPDQLGRVDESGDDHLVLGLWVLGVLGLNHLFQRDVLLDHGGHISTPHHVIETHGDEHAHGSGLVLVVYIEGMGQVRDSTT